ncbi:GntR family transcriptional regulator [Bacillus sp. FSL K6-3431]|uniref:GntR family transcriptional regulator n=1 Tax=Bacillus sp. FSL K6-3431 TaxID=2921500 RepID=UPI0030FC5135
MKNNKPLYRKIIDYLKEKIANEEYLPGERIPSEIELAEQFDVSRITSKRALVELELEGIIYRARGKGSFVKGDNRLNIQSKDVKNKSKMISMILPFKDENGSLDYIKGASSFLESKGYYLTIQTTDQDWQKEKKFLEELPLKGIEGIIFYPQTTNRHLEILNTLAMNKYPVVTIDKHFESASLISVISDNFQGGYECASHLIKLKHRRIAFVSYRSIETLPTVRDRYFGYCQALLDHSIEVNPTIVKINFSVEISQKDLKTFYTDLIRNFLKNGVTAIQSENDIIAIGLINTAGEMGLNIPRDLSIIGFDNLPISENLEPPLTTIAQNFEQIGKCAAKLIVKQIERRTSETKNIILPVKLISRDSTSTRNVLEN